MSVRRENTFRIDYANVPKKPSFDELHDFVATELGLSYEQVLRLQPSRALGCAFVKVIDLDLAQKVVAEHDNKHEVVIDGKNYNLRITLEDGAVEVKLTDLSEDITNNQIAEFLSAYGEVLSVTEQLWDSKYRFAGRPTGARIARMVVKRNIESYVTIDGQTTNVAYSGQLQTCRHCSEFGHNGISCVQNKKLLVQKTYANVTKQMGPKLGGPKSTAPTQKKPFAKPAAPKLLTQQPATALPSSSAPKLSVQNSGEPKQVKTNHPELGATLKAPQILVGPVSRIITRSATHAGAQSDGNDTDASSASGSNRKKKVNPAKKQRPNHPDDDVSEEMDSEIL